jgi:hypothetical protein
VDAARKAAAEAETRQAAARPAASKPSLPLESYAGTYADSWHGDISITWEQSRLVMRFSHAPALTGDLAILDATVALNQQVDDFPSNCSCFRQLLRGTHYPTEMLYDWQ